MISVRVQPGARRNEIALADGLVRVKIAAPPVKGQANRELVAYLSQVLQVGRDAVTIVSGRTSRSKVVAVDGLDQAEVLKRLSSAG
ncbi:MAG: YggU family protein [Chloroflexi bacterium]|nr:YggU family protein [Chloroflexota bacterium]